MRNLVILSAGRSQPSTTRMLADRIAAESLERMRELEVKSFVDVLPDRAWSGYRHEFAGNTTDSGIPGAARNACAAAIQERPP